MDLTADTSAALMSDCAEVHAGRNCNTVHKWHVTNEACTDKIEDGNCGRGFKQHKLSFWLQ